MSGRLEGKVAIVTGGGQGIGEAAALRMAEEGARIVVSDVNAETGEAVAAAVRDAGGEAVFVPADVAALDDVKALMAATADAFGRLDVLHNNAGVHETNFTLEAQSHELDEEVWDKVVAINLKGVWMCSKHAVPLMSESGGGSIVNAASIGGIVGYPMGAAYGPSKAGVIQLSRVMALELAPMNIRVNSYAPGNTDTPMVQKYFSSGAAGPAGDGQAAAHRHAPHPAARRADRGGQPRAVPGVRRVVDDHRREHHHRHGHHRLARDPRLAAWGRRHGCARARPRASTGSRARRAARPRWRASGPAGARSSWRPRARGTRWPGRCSRTPWPSAPAASWPATWPASW